jgi:dTDP-4-dehydrorhamnose reductase
MTRRRVAITGARGQLGAELVRAFANSGDEVLALARPDFDITRTRDLERLTAWNPNLVINSAAWTDVDACARDPERAMWINGEAAGAVARAADGAGALMLQISTNEVFDGTLERPYIEGDAPNPVNPYGVSKLAGERLVAVASPRHVIVRTAWLFGATRGFPQKMRVAADRARAAGQPLRVVADEWGNPTNSRWLSGATVALVNLIIEERTAHGTYHLAGWPPTTRLEWARRVLASTDAVLEPIRLVDYVRDSTVPPRAVLDVARAASLGIEAGSWP